MAMEASPYLGARPGGVMGEADPQSQPTIGKSHQ
ncbi:hypothetical protein BJ122_11972 [Rhodopseudomonas faecalis]|uniref:Uncharacterized protein n=1 Tax=Rhodopseudomonas faecalis TaxID=99655 RepID=A0A318TCY4_9BRAD|nr:hypothetical protein BJ122_11972 [Rhodopseudomonas faecalis]